MIYAGDQGLGGMWRLLQHLRNTAAAVNLLYLDFLRGNWLQSIKILNYILVCILPTYLPKLQILCMLDPPKRLNPPWLLFNAFKTAHLGRGKDDGLCRQILLHGVGAEVEAETGQPQVQQAAEAVEEAAVRSQLHPASGNWTFEG